MDEIKVETTWRLSICRFGTWSERSYASRELADEAMQIAVNAPSVGILELRKEVVITITEQIHSFDRRDQELDAEGRNEVAERFFGPETRVGVEEDLVEATLKRAERPATGGVMWGGVHFPAAAKAGDTWNGVLLTEKSVREHRGEE